MNDLELLIFKAKIRKLIQSRSRRGKLYWKQVWVNVDDSPGQNQKKSLGKEAHSKTREVVASTKAIFQNNEFKHSIQKWQSLPKSRKVQITKAGKKYQLSYLETLLVFHYTTREGNINLNQLLRDHKVSELSISQKNIIRGIDNAIKKLPKAKGIMFRKIQVDEKNLARFLSRYAEDRIVMENQFTSTSKNKKHILNREGNIIFEYDQFSGRDIIPFSFHPEESEILIQRKRYFKVKSVDTSLKVVKIKMREVRTNGYSSGIPKRN